jgi:hypothetical protein
VRRTLGKLIVVLIGCACAFPVAALARKHHKGHHHAHHHHKVAGKPSLEVLGFGVNHLFVANGADVTDASDCSTAVQGNGYLDGPPQNVYFDALVKAVDIPATADVSIDYEFPEGEAVGDEEPTLSPGGTFGNDFSKNLIFPTPPNPTDAYRFEFVSYDDADGPSASDFNGAYSFEVQADINGETLDAKGQATVSCPYG